MGESHQHKVEWKKTHKEAGDRILSLSDSRQPYMCRIVCDLFFVPFISLFLCKYHNVLISKILK